MNDLIATAYADRRVWLFVTGGTLLAGLVFVMPGVDTCNALRADCNDLIESKHIADRTAEQTQKYESQVIAQEQQLTELRNRTLREEDVADFRNELVKLVRDSGCQLRRLNISSPRAREWRAGDSPLAAVDGQLPGTPFHLETRVVSLTLNGSLARIRLLMDRVQASDKYAYARTIDMRPASHNATNVDVNLELWFFALQPRNDA